MPGRPPNPSRNLARDAGETTYNAEASPCFCGGVVRYTSNAQCVDCAIAKGKERYAALDPGERETLRVKDHARYERRLRRNRAPSHRRSRNRDPLDP